MSVYKSVIHFTCIVGYSAVSISINTHSQLSLMLISQAQCLFACCFSSRSAFHCLKSVRQILTCSLIGSKRTSCPPAAQCRRVSRCKICNFHLALRIFNCPFGPRRTSRIASLAFLQVASPTWVGLLMSSECPRSLSACLSGCQTANCAALGCQSWDAASTWKWKTFTKVSTKHEQTHTKLSMAKVINKCAKWQRTPSPSLHLSLPLSLSEKFS